MNPTRKIATNCLSAIGYRLILGVLASVFAVIAFAGEYESDSKSGCKIWVPNPMPGASVEWSGVCDKNGFADKAGTLQWFRNGEPSSRYKGELRDGKMNGKGVLFYSNGDQYDGDWLDGKQHGKGINIRSNGSKYFGESQNGKLHGFGKLTVRRENTKTVESWDGKGKWIGDIYTVEGMFEEGRLTLSCTSPQNCKQEQAKREVQERREAADRERDKATACSKYYNGYVGYVDYNNGKRDFWGQDIGNKYGRFVVLGSGGGSVSIKGVDGGSYPGYDKMDNVSCTWLREKER